MNSNISRIATTLMLAGIALASTPAQAEYRCDKPQSRIHRMACDKAAESPEALARFIHRMRTVENLYFFDYVRDDTLPVVVQPRPGAAPVAATTQSTPANAPEK